MKINVMLFRKAFGIVLISIAFIGCQEMDRPELGDYAKDANAAGGPLKFFVAFDGTSDNVLMNAVDSVRANFPSDNALKSIPGIKGKGAQGQIGKYIRYGSANDFAKTAGSFTVALWQKKGEFRTEEIFSMPAVGGYHWSGGSMFLLMEGNAAEPIVKFFVKDATDEKWFEWVPWGPTGAVSGIYDGQWHHLAFVYDGATSTMTLYKNGVAGTTSKWGDHGPIKLEPSKITSLIVGAGPSLTEGDWLGNSWTGGLDQFRMYATALTAAEVNALYTKKR